MPKHARVLSETEFETLLGYIEGMKFAARNRLLMFLTHRAGMRVGEVSSLRNSDLLAPVDVCLLDNGRAAFNSAVVIGEEQYFVVPQIQLRAREVKAKYARSVVLSNVVRQEIKRFYEDFSDVDLRQKVFLNRHGDPMSNVALSQEIRRMYLDAGFAGASSHSGRRGFVTGLLDKQVNVRVVQELVGHRQLNTTQRYAETHDQRLREAVELL